jgi:hypothetical protein
MPFGWVFCVGSRSLEGIGEQATRRACVFCQARDRKITKEHVWPKWLRLVIEGGEGPLLDRKRVHLTRDGEVVTQDTWREFPIDWEVSGPCKPCNEGWMERIEGATQPILKPMLRDEPVQLEVAAQDTLAQWATLRMMMAQHGHPKDRRRSIPETRYHGFYRRLQIPPGVQIWLARYDGSGAWPTNYVHREITISGEPLAQPNTYLAAFSVGYVAFVYWGHEVEDGAIAHPGEGMKPFLVPIWPPTRTVSWPPRGLLGATGLDAVVENLVGTS